MRRPLALLVASFLSLCTGSRAWPQVPAAPTGAARGLPSTVNAAFEKAHPGATITAAEPDREEGKIVFRVAALDGKRRLALVYELDGTLVESAEEVSEADLPGPVAAAMRSGGQASFVKGARVTRGLKVHYELTVRGTRKATMVVKADGTVVASK